MTHQTTRYVSFHIVDPDDRDPDLLFGGPPHMNVRPGFSVPRIGEKVVLEEHRLKGDPVSYAWFEVVDVLHSMLNANVDADYDSLIGNAHDGWVDILVRKLDYQTHPLDLWRASLDA